MVWDFGDGTTDSSTGVPTHTYTDPGTYTVTMTATNMYGSDTITETDLVTVNGQVMNNGAIFAQSIPAGAMIYVNGNSYGTSPVTINNLFPGTYTVQASLNGYPPILGLFPCIRAGPPVIIRPCNPHRTHPWLPGLFTPSPLLPGQAYT